MHKIAWSTEELRNQYEYFNSGYFFSKDTMRFFKSRLTSNYKRIDDTTALFITTEKSPFGPRKANIRKATLKKYIREKDQKECYKIEINTINEFNELTLQQAKRKLLKGI